MSIMQGKDLTSLPVAGKNLNDWAYGTTLKRDTKRIYIVSS